jgi:hypothetical protein
MDATRIALLACLHLQDKVDTMRQELNRLASLLDSVVER